MVTTPIRDLLKTDVHSQWNASAQKALELIKETLSTEPVLHYFDPSAVNVIQADASQHGLGACLLQRGRPVAYDSCGLSASECNYAQIEKELVANSININKFYGFSTRVQTDHKPLETIVKSLYTKHLHIYRECYFVYRNMTSTFAMS